MLCEAGLVFTSTYSSVSQAGCVHVPLSIQKQVGQLSQTNHAVACVSFGKNVSAKSMHLTSLVTTV